MIEDQDMEPSATTEQAVYRMAGHFGVLISKMKPAAISDLKKRLTLKQRGWRDEPPTIVEAHYEEDGYFWVPRYFYEEAALDRMGQRPVQFEWTDGDPADLQGSWALKPEFDQPKAVEAMVQHIRNYSGGVLIAPTGCGKTVMSYAIAKEFKTKIGVLVYADHMRDNWIKTAKSYFGLDDDDIAVVQEDTCDLDRPVTIMMVQSLLARTYPSRLYQQMGFLIADEVNHYGAPQWSTALRQFPARYRLGMSADPTRADGLDRMIEWNFGKPGYRISTKEAVANPDVVQILYQAQYPENRYCDWDFRTQSFVPNPARYDKVLRGDKFRNQMLVEEICQAAASGRRIMVFAKHRVHLTTLKDMFEKAYAKKGGPPVKATFMVGRPKTKKAEAERQDAYTGDVMFATYAYCSAALNLPELDTLYFATPPGKPLQPIGRLRKQGPADRKRLLVVDVFEAVEWSQKKARSRRYTYEQLGCKITQLKRVPKVVT